jgi:uncharacterized protein YjbJ (UPF0337 family)
VSTPSGDCERGSGFAAAAFGYPTDTGPTDRLRRSRGAAVAMDDKIDNKAEELKGKAKEGVGHATDDEELTAEGKGDQASSNLKQAGEKVKDAAKDVFKK